MSRFCFVTYEIHPTTWGGCGVLLRHAAELLLRQGHEVVFLLDIPPHEFQRFCQTDRLTFTNAERCRGYRVDDLCHGFPWTSEQIPNGFQWKALRFAHALSKLAEAESFDYVEFFEYCGPAYYALVRKLFGFGPDKPVLGVRLHNSLEIIDRHEATKPVDRDRYVMYGLEHGALELAEAVLAPTETYYKEYYQKLYGLTPGRVAVSQSPRMSFPPVSRRPGGESFHIVCYGRVHQFKGVEQLIRAGVLLLKRRPHLDCRFDLIGPEAWESPMGQSYIGYLRTLIPQSLQDRFLFPGFLGHAQVSERLNDALFAVFPNWFESFCYALHEVYEAGVPVVVNDLPGFRDFFAHEKNALVYDGSTKGLLHAMERMIDDPALRARLAKPYPVATAPLGAFYDDPKPLSPVRDSRIESAAPLHPLVVILEDSANGDGGAALASLSAQTFREFDATVLRPASVEDDGMFLWLGRPWLARDAQGAAVAALDIETRDAIAIFHAGDRLAPQWLDLCVRALRARPAVAFAGTWARTNGRILPATIDIVPEAYPFWNGAARAHVLVRTDPGTLLLDLFDPNLGPLGEIGCLWKAVGRWGPGRLLPEPLLEAADARPSPAEAKRLNYLISRYGEPFSPRLAILAGVMQMETSAISSSASPTPAALPVQTPAPAGPPLSPLDAANSLNGTTLAKLALAKLRAKIRARLARFFASRPPSPPRP